MPGARTLAFARVTPSCAKWKGGFANAWSDEQSAVAVRAAELAGEPSFRGGVLAVWVDAARAKGQRALLAAGPRDGFRTQLREMTKAAGVPQSDCGGAWSMGSEQARRSYVFASIQDGDIDYWIDLARRSGFSIIHINDYSWSGLLGPYPINPKAFPGGIDEMKRAADRVHAAGLQMGIHSLTGCINPRADWIHPVCDTNLVADYVYTLARPLAPDATELVVEELPGPKHSTVFTYSSNGNVLQIGGELMQYTGIRREKPYAFTGLTRGAFKTTKFAGTIPAGTRVAYLHQRYIAFYPNPDSPLAEKLASRLAEVYNFCGLDDFYFDGSEGMGTRYGIDAMRHKIFAKFARNNGHSASVEASCGGANNWWFQTRMATVDHPVWGAKRFHDWHITWAVDQGRNANFLEPQMGGARTLPRRHGVLRRKERGTRRGDVRAGHHGASASRGHPPPAGDPRLVRARAPRAGVHGRGEDLPRHAGDRGASAPGRGGQLAADGRGSPCPPRGTAVDARVDG